MNTGGISRLGVTPAICRQRSFRPRGAASSQPFTLPRLGSFDSIFVDVPTDKTGSRRFLYAVGDTQASCANPLVGNIADGHPMRCPSAAARKPKVLDRADGAIKGPYFDCGCGPSTPPLPPAAAVITGYAYIDGSLAYAFELERRWSSADLPSKNLGGFSSFLQVCEGLPDLIARLPVADQTMKFHGL